MKLILSILLAFTAFCATAQTQADYIVYSKNGKAHLEAMIYLKQAQPVVQSSPYCEDGTTLSFCLRNYLSENLLIRVNGGEPLDFVIEASLANSNMLQINLSTEQDIETVTEWTITNNAFVDDLPTFVNQMTIKLNGTETKVALDSENREVTVD